MLVAAAFWRLDGPRGDLQSVLTRPELGALRLRLAPPRRPGGGRRGQLAGRRAWLPLMAEYDRGYGFVDVETPELSIGVLPTHRGRGVGSSRSTRSSCPHVSSATRR